MRLSDYEQHKMDEAYSAHMDRVAAERRRKAERCPRCGSSRPHLHPAVQVEGEVSLCLDDFHLSDTPQNHLYRKQVIAAQQREAEHERIKAAARAFIIARIAETPNPNLAAKLLVGDLEWVASVMAGFACEEVTSALGELK